ncbi:interleukin-7 receptor subunit alpha [Cyclopterus lumpus]|uniref:Fibronectin type-III domain-containing protein n=1 Tax=Cyclopterus lumpus TaxID=8103 RepID=A0A8C2Z864_CYCLU|nr:interleukin-7 receptor subunit alpha [Cyclopterus lumpus]
MLLSCCIAALLLLPAGTRPQSGDGAVEPRIRCSSHLLTTGSSLSCKLVGGWSDDEDDEDEDGEADAVVNMAVCFYDFNQNEAKCLEASGDTVTHLNPVFHFNVTVHLKTGGRVTATVDLKTIVRPRSPQVNNVSFDQVAQRAVIRFQTPYSNEYIKVDNQLFQLHIWTAGSSITQNVSADTSLEVGMELLQQHAEYHVKVRAIPEHGLQGSWSEWSETFTFFTPADLQKKTDERRETNKLIVVLLILVAVPSSVIFFCKNKIFSYMWPSIPHPKHTLVHICKTNKGLLLNFKPEEFNALKVEKTEEMKPPIAAEAAGSTQSTPSCSTQFTQSTPSCSTQSTQFTPSCSTQSTQSTPSCSTQSTQFTPSCSTQSTQSTPSCSTQSTQSTPSCSTQSTQSTPSCSTQSTQFTPSCSTQSTQSTPSCSTQSTQFTPSCSTQSTQSTPSCSTQSSASVSTESSTLLSRRSSDGEDSLQSSGPSPVEGLWLGGRARTPRPECSSGANEAEAYVTMSSFCQIK